MIEEGRWVDRDDVRRKRWVDKRNVRRWVDRDDVRRKRWVDKHNVRRWTIEVVQGGEVGD